MRNAWVATIGCAWLLAASPVSRAADCNRNGVEDLADVSSGASRDCNANLVPDECDIADVNYGLTPARVIRLRSGPPSSIIARDLDGDGDVDLAFSSAFEGGVGILVRGRAGELVLFPQQLPADGAFALVAGDFDGDGDADLAAGGPALITVLVNQVAPRFASGGEISTGIPTAAMAVADLDGDKDLDLIAAGASAVTLLVNGGSGRFETGQSLTIGSGPIAVLATDIDGDGDQDIVTANQLDNISLLRNDGAAKLAAPRNYASGERPLALAAGDLDGDGDLDVAVAASDGNAYVLSNRGGGLLDVAVAHPLGTGAACMVAADLDLDGDTDLAFGLAINGLSVLLNRGAGRLGLVSFSQLQEAPHSMTTTDFNANGSVDLVSANFNQSTVSIFSPRPIANSNDCNTDAIPDDCQLKENDCNSNTILDACDIASGASQDCNRNSIPDDCEADCNGNKVPDDCDVSSGKSPDCNANGRPDECDLGGVDPKLQPGAAVSIPDVPIQIEAFDANGDTSLDVAVLAGGAVQLFLGRGGQLEQEKRFFEGEFPISVASGDLDGDGDVDLVGAGKLSGGLPILFNRGDGTFEAGPELLRPGHVTLCVAIADFDKDGTSDLAAGTFESPDLFVFINRGGGAFSDALQQQVGAFPAVLKSADFDGDGNLDLAAFGNQNGMVSVIRNRGNGVFEPGAVVDPNKPQSFAIADLDGDDDVDLISSGGAMVGLSIFLNDGRGKFPAARNYGAALPPQLIVTGDFDRDGDPDVAAALGGDLNVFLNDPGASFERFAPVERLQLFATTCLFAGDLDDEGGMDVVVGGSVICPNCELAFSGGIHMLINRTSLPSSRDLDHNRIPDECEGAFFHRGDANGDGAMSLTDAVAVLDYLFKGGSAPRCLESADIENNGLVNLSDPIALLSFLFRGGVAPAAPGPPAAPCGHDPDRPGSPGSLGCESYAICE